MQPQHRVAKFPIFYTEWIIQSLTQCSNIFTYIYLKTFCNSARSKHSSSSFEECLFSLLSREKVCGYLYCIWSQTEGFEIKMQPQHSNSSFEECLFPLLSKDVESHAHKFPKNHIWQRITNVCLRNLNATKSKLSSSSFEECFLPLLSK